MKLLLASLLFLLLPALQAAEHQLKVTKRKIEGKVWPEVTIEATVNANSLEAVAIFSAYDLQKSYIPNMVKSDVVEQPGPTNVVVAYEMKMPWPVSKSEYVHGHYLTSPKKDSYKVEWYMVRSDAADNVRGSALFEQLGPNRTRLTYISFMDPKSFFAGIFRKLMIRDVQKSIHAILDKIHHMKANQAGEIPALTERVKKALRGEYAYPKK
jgi:hypothetical protein